VVIVHVNPQEREALPCTAAEIIDRVDEISFSSSLLRELRAIAFVTGLIDQGLIDQGRIGGRGLKRVLVHENAADEAMARLGAMSKLVAGWDKLTRLRDLGRASAEAWLPASFARRGRESTVDLGRCYLA